MTHIEIAIVAWCVVLSVAFVAHIIHDKGTVKRVEDLEKKTGR